MPGGDEDDVGTAVVDCDIAEAGVSEEEVKGLIAKAMKEFAASLIAE